MNSTFSDNMTRRRHISAFLVSSLLVLSPTKGAPFLSSYFIWIFLHGSGGGGSVATYAASTTCATTTRTRTTRRRKSLSAGRLAIDRAWYPTAFLSNSAGRFVSARFDSKKWTDEPTTRTTPMTTATTMSATERPATIVRDWTKHDFDDISSILLLGGGGWKCIHKEIGCNNGDDGSYDPEGPIAIDCGSAQAISESYDPEDGGCFLIATDASIDRDDDKDGRFGGGVVIGTAGVVVGVVQIATSSPSATTTTTTTVTTAAARHVCALSESYSHAYDSSSSLSSSSTTGRRRADDTIRELLRVAESRAVRAGAEEMILLAYRRPPEKESGDGIFVVVVRPYPELLRELGYSESRMQLHGVAEAVRQYCKRLVRKSECAPNGTERYRHSPSPHSSSSSSSSLVSNYDDEIEDDSPLHGLVEALLGAVLAAALMASAVGYFHQP